MKPNTKIMGAKSWIFPMVGGPNNKLKYRICEPLPTTWKILTPAGHTLIYRKTDLPERKRWPVMYVYDEVMSDDSNRTSDVRSRRLERLAKTILYGPEHWDPPPGGDGRTVQKTAQSKGKRKSADIPTTRRAGNG